MAFHLYYHHQLEELAGMYLRHRQMKLEDFRQGDVLGKETVVVPTYGVAVWLEHHLVRAGVVSAGVDFPVMRNAISDLLHITMTEYEPEQFSRAALTWRIFTVFCQDGHASEFPEVLRNYLEAPGEQDPLLRKFEFAGVVAQLFEEYQSYLPQTLTRWGRGVDLGLVVRERDGNLQKLDENLRWQPWLWNRICNPEAGKHLVSLAEAIVRFGEASTATRPSYPVTVFGASAMPPAFLKVLVDYAKNATVNFYYRNPSREYWGDNLEKWRQSKSEELEVFQNDLLANYATQAKEFFKAIVDMVPDFGGDLAILEETAEQTPQTLLGAIQEQIVNNENPSEPMELREEDDSLVVYNCFNATREVEALRDALLLLLKRHPNDYTLNDIIVMAPDIAAFAPAIRAVFDNCELRGQYSLSDRSIRQANLLAEGFLEILRLPASRFEASRVTQLLDSQPLRNRFDFSEEDVTTIRQWMATAQIRLDYDLKDRQKRNSHMDDEAYTWQLGLDRMLLSLAVDTPIDSEKRTLGFAELEPLPFTEEGMGDANRTLGHFCAFLRKLHETAQELTAVSERTAVEWRDLLLDILQRFFRADADSALDHYTLRSCINALATDATSGGYTGKLPFSIVQTILEGTLEGAQPKAPFLEGKITCCSMMPMREVPCKVLAMLGMDAGSFPHRDASTGFTLLRRGSPLPYYVRSRIQEDQYIFLEAIQSVREHLLIFYHGQDDKNPDASAAKLSPAPVVEELLAYAENACQLSNGGDVRKELVVKRNLNSFDAKNFRPKTERQEELSLRSSFSFDQVSHAIAMTAEGESSGEEIWKSYYALPMLAEYPVREAEGGLQLELTDWEQFFKNPMRFFLQRRLNYGKRSDESDELEDSERFAVTSPLEKWSIRTTIFNQILLPETPDVELVERRLRRASQLPLGDLGSQAMRELRKSVKLPDELNSLALWRNQTPQEFSVETEVPSDLFEGLPELAKLRPVGMGCRLNALRERVPVRLHGSFPVAELNGACGIAMVCHSKCVEKNGLVPQYILAPYLHWLVLAANEDGRFPFVKFLDTKEGQLIDFLSEELIARQDLAEYARGRLAQLAQLYLLGHFIPLPLCLNSNAKESMTLIYGCNDLKGIREMQAGIQEVQNVLWASDVLL